MPRTSSEYNLANLYLYRVCYSYCLIDGESPHFVGQTYDGASHTLPLCPLDADSAHAVLAGRLGPGQAGTWPAGQGSEVSIEEGCVKDKIENLRNKCAELDTFLGTLALQDWGMATDFFGWTVADEVMHFHLVDQFGTVSLTTPDTFPALVAEVREPTIAHPRSSPRSHACLP
jgi:hypothetical protein